MDEENKTNRTYPVNAIRVCIDEANGDLKGRIYSKMSSEPLHFSNCGELILKTDAMFDACGYPQTFQEKRVFRGERSTGRYARPSVVLSDAQLIQQSGKCRTVDILVKSRRRAGWQGILWENPKAPGITFESVIELLRHLGKEAEHTPQENQCSENTACS